jgi:hypothetical protein
MAKITLKFPSPPMGERAGVRGNRILGYWLMTIALVMVTGVWGTFW